MRKELNRNRFIYAGIIVVLIVVGLATRTHPTYFPNFIAEYGGDTLWAMTAYVGFAFLWQKSSILRVILFSLGFAYFIEISQLYQADWINDIRNTTIGALVLGHGFLWSDMMCYSVGIFSFAGIEYFAFNNTKIKNARK